MAGELGKAIAQKITKKMTREQLEKHVKSKLKTQTMCTLITSKGDIPRGTPLEYFPDGLTLYIWPDPGTKVKNLRVNPNVSVSICNVIHPDWENNWQTVWGLQITGKGELFEDGHPEHTRGIEVTDFESFFRALGWGGNEILKKRKALKVTPSKIELLEFGLITEGFAFRQVWRARG